MEYSDIFNDYTYNGATLTVPAASVNAYSNTDYWNMFVNIVGMGGIPGDLNGDGILGIGDVTDMIDALLSGSD